MQTIGYSNEANRLSLSYTERDQVNYKVQAINYVVTLYFKYASIMNYEHIYNVS